MFQVVTDRAKSNARTNGAGAERATRALELVALRGRDVVGVRHVLDGGKCWMGDTTDALAKVASAEFGTTPFVLADAHGGVFRVVVPAKARLRMHTKEGLGRIALGPCSFTLNDGDKAVVVLGKLQVRLQFVAFTAPVTRGIHLPTGAAGWIALLGALYVVALMLCAALAPSETPRLDHGLAKAFRAPAAGTPLHAPAPSSPLGEEGEYGERPPRPPAGAGGQRPPP